MKNIEYNTYNTLKFQDYALSFQIFILLDLLILIDLFVHLNFNEVLEDGVQALVPVKWHDQKNFNGPFCHFELKSKCSSGMFKHLDCTNTDTVNKIQPFMSIPLMIKWFILVCMQKCRPSYQSLFFNSTPYGYNLPNIKSTESQYIRVVYLD